MTRFKWLSFVLIAVLLVANFSPVYAQDYSFALLSESVVLSLNSDGTASLDYTWLFQNDPSAPYIEYVDVGLPNEDYDFSTVSASANGTPVYDISQVSNGVSIYLGNNSIAPGDQGTVTLHVGGITNMLYKGTADEAEPYASVQFSPNWFGSQYVHGATLVNVTIFLPVGMNSEEPRYFTPSNWPGSSEPTASGFDDQGRVYFQWQSEQANGYDQYTFGAAFPARLVPESAISTPPLIDFRFEEALPCLCFGGFFLFIILMIVLGVNSARKRKLQYLPPKIALEGHGIKRGLTAVEAGILMEEPMDKILTMTLFSTIKKNAAKVITRDPLKLEINDPLPEDLYPYEADFLKAMQKITPKEQRLGLQDMMVNLVKGVSEKMSGFSRKETLVFYQDIMKRAWEMVESADTPEVKSQKFEEVMDWTMLDDKYGDRTKEVFGSNPVFLPRWWGGYDPSYRSTSTGGGGGLKTSGAPTLSAGKSSGTVSMPSLPGADFAASITNSVQTMAAGVVGNVSDFTGNVTNKTNPAPKPTYTSSRGGGFSGGGGHSCACACACAGCACACAGGGR